MTGVVVSEMWRDIASGDVVSWVVVMVSAVSRDSVSGDVVLGAAMRRGSIGMI